MILTEEQIYEIASRVKAIIRAESKNVGEVPEVSSLAGVLSLPALRYNGGVPEVVRAPLSVLEQPGLAAAEAANEAAAAANQAAQNVGNAADSANTAAANATTAASLAEEKGNAAQTAAGLANEKATLANTAAGNANSAAQSANEAAAAANEGASTVNSATQNAQAAAQAATQAAATAAEETAKIIYPTALKIEYPANLTLGNNNAHLNAQLLPARARQNIIYLAVDDTVSVNPSGQLKLNKTGTAQVYVIPTQATDLYKTATITINKPVLRLLSGNRMRLITDDKLRLT
jgi:hypothetical protein